MLVSMSFAVYIREVLVQGKGLIIVLWMCGCMVESNAVNDVHKERSLMHIMSAVRFHPSRILFSVLMPLICASDVNHVQAELGEQLPTMPGAEGWRSQLELVTALVPVDVDNAVSDVDEDDDFKCRCVPEEKNGPTCFDERCINWATKVREMQNFPLVAHIKPHVSD